MIPFNKPYLSGKELSYIEDAVHSKHISGNGKYSKKCHDLLENRYGYKKTLLTTSCTDALEMCSILIGISPGDEVIVPSFTFVSTALAFVRQGAKIVFADSKPNHPNMDEEKIEQLISPKTKAIVVVHYGGVACNMNYIMDLAKKNNIFVVEDAAQSIDSYYENKPLGGIGHLGCLSFHETKNIQCGEGGLLIVNDERFIERAEIIWEKGTDRAKFFRGETDKYGWVDIGSSFLLSDLNAAYLYSQLEKIESIQKRRIEIWDLYRNNLQGLSEKFNVEISNEWINTSKNGHVFYLTCNNIKERTELIFFLRRKMISSVFHYQSLHKSQFYLKTEQVKNMEFADKYSDRLLRLPLFFELTDKEVNYICEQIQDFYE